MAAVRPGMTSPCRKLAGGIAPVAALPDGGQDAGAPPLVDGPVRDPQEPCGLLGRHSAADRGRPASGHRIPMTTS